MVSKGETLQETKVRDMYFIYENKIPFAIIIIFKLFMRFFFIILPSFFGKSTRIFVLFHFDFQTTFKNPDATNTIEKKLLLLTRYGILYCCNTIACASVKLKL